MAQIPPIDLQALLERQITERYRSVLVTGPACFGKSKYARELADALSVPYLDLLNEFANNEELSANIDLFDWRKLLDFLKSKLSSEKMIILDNVDFLINTWTDRTRREFCEWLGKLDNVQYPTVLCVFAQDDEAFEEVSYTPTSIGNLRIMRFQDLQVI